MIKICMAFQRAKADSQERAEAQLARRGLWTFKEDDGIVRMTTPRSRLRWGTPGRGPRPAPVHQASEAGHAGSRWHLPLPGLTVPARWTHLHHLIPWELGGPTDLANCLSLGNFHHARLHDGHYRILGSPDGELHFETPDGRPIVPPAPRLDPASGGTAQLRQRARELGHQIDGMTPPMALDAGQPVDYELALEMLVHNDKLHKARAGPLPVRAVLSSGFTASSHQVRNHLAG